MGPMRKACLGEQDAFVDLSIFPALFRDQRKDHKSRTCYCLTPLQANHKLK